MTITLLARPAGYLLRNAALRSGILGLRVFGASRVASIVPAVTTTFPSRNASHSKSFDPISTNFQNSPVPFRHASTALDTHGVKTWKYFRYLTLGMFATIPMAIYVPNPVIDYALASFITLHAYWGMDEIITDYVHAPATQALVRNFWRAWVTVSFFGLLYFTYNDVGIIKAIGLIWSLNSN